jgi:ABC-2 type transport system permease protein
MIGYGVVLAVTTYVQAAAYTQVAGTTAASRATFVHDMTALAAQLTYFLPAPYRLDTLAGYVQWRAYGGISLVVMIWAIASAASAVRADEDRQLVDYWLAARVSRPRLVAWRLATFAVVALVAAAASGLGAMAGAASSEPLSPGPLAGQAFALWLLTVTLFALCYLVSQLTASLRGAQAAGAALVVFLYLCDVLARSQHSFDGLAWVSPFKWYDATNVLAPGGHLDAAGTLLSVAVTVAAGGLAALAFSRRDLRASLFARPARDVTARDARPSPLLSWPVARLLYRQRWVLAGWMAGLAVMAVFMVGSARGIVNSIANLPGMRAFLTGGAGGDPYRGFIGAYWFGFAQLLLAGFAVHLVSIWGSDDTDGILAAELSTPRQRWTVVAERAVSAVVGVAVAVAVGSLVAAATASAFGSALDASGVLRASLLLVPFALSFAAVGAAAGAWWPRAVVGVLGILTAFSFLVWEIAPLMRWPTWVADLSVFQLYGRPFTSGVFWNGVWAMVAIVVVGFGLATLLMQRREVAS